MTIRGAAVGRKALSVAAVGAALLALVACGGDGPPHSAGPDAPADGHAGAMHFVDVADRAGLDRITWAGRPGKDHLLDSAGTGVAWLDYDGDGWLDAYLVNAWKLDGDRIVERGRNALYRNLGDGTFEDATEGAGVGGDGRWGSGVAVADYDDDGLPDILVTNFGPNLLYRNRGDGTFEEVAVRAGVDVPGWNTGASFFDSDGDGDLDVYIATYIEQEIEEVLAARPTLDWKGVAEVAVGPFGLPGAADHFFLSNGDGTFTEATAEAGLTDLGLGFGFGTRAVDVDLDGDVDLYVANDSDANYLYRNDGGVFRETGLFAGAAFDANGAAQAGMGVAAADANGDGLVDLFVTNFAEDFSTLYLGGGDGFFEDAAGRSGIGEATRLPLSWGTALADLDNDGDRDLVIANGHIYPQVDAHPEFSQRYAQPNQLLMNTGKGSFADVSTSAGPGFEVLESSRGLAVGDYDNDGDLDLLVSNLDAPPTLLRNDSAGGNWITLVPRVPPGRGGLIGTRVRLETAGGLRLVGDVASGDSFLSSHDPRLHFGLGAEDRVATIEIHWPEGSRTTLEDVEANQFVEVSPPTP